MSNRRIEFMRVDALTPALSNPKGHDIKRLRGSVARFGFTNPAIMDERTGRLVAGHGRLELLQTDMANETVAPDGVMIDEDGSWLIPVLRGWESANDAEAQAYLISDNRQTELATWLDDDLAAMLRDLADSEGGTAGIGFSPADLRRLYRKASADVAPPVVEALDQRADLHRNRQIHTMVFDYPLSDYNYVTAMFQPAAGAHGVETLAELFIQMLTTFDTTHPEEPS